MADSQSITQLKALNPRIVAMMAAKCKPRKAPMNQRRLRLLDGPLGGHTWHCSLDVAIGRPATLTFAVRGVTGYYVRASIDEARFHRV